MSMSARAASLIAVIGISAGLSLEAQDTRVMQVLERARLALARGAERALPTTFAITGRRTLSGEAGKTYTIAFGPSKGEWCPTS